MSRMLSSKAILRIERFLSTSGIETWLQTQTQSFFILKLNSQNSNSKFLYTQVEQSNSDQDGWITFLRVLRKRTLREYALLGVKSMHVWMSSSTSLQL